MLLVAISETWKPALGCSHQGTGWLLGRGYGQMGWAGEHRSAVHVFRCEPQEFQLGTAAIAEDQWPECLCILIWVSPNKTYIYIHSKPHHQTPWLLWFSHVKIYEMWDEHSWPNSSMERWLQGFVPSLVMPIWGWKLSEHVNRPTAPNMNIWLWLIFLEQTWRIPISERTRIHN